MKLSMAGVLFLTIHESVSIYHLNKFVSLLIHDPRSAGRSMNPQRPQPLRLISCENEKPQKRNQKRLSEQKATKLTLEFSIYATLLTLTTLILRYLSA